MKYRIIYKDENGAQWEFRCENEKAKTDFCTTLDRAGIQWIEKNGEEKLWQCARCVFDIQLIEPARKAIKEGKELKGLYTFGDKDEIAEKDKLVKAECFGGDIRIVYVVDIWHATATEIKDYKKKIGRDHLSMIVDKV